MPSTGNKTTVVNIRDCPPYWQQSPDYVYCARPSEWGNRHVVAPNQCSVCRTYHPRGEGVRLHRKETLERCEREPAYRERIVSTFKGRHCVCYCAPRPCHCDVYAEIAEGS